MYHKVKLEAEYLQYYKFWYISIHSTLLNLFRLHLYLFLKLTKINSNEPITKHARKMYSNSSFDKDSRKPQSLAKMTPHFYHNRKPCKGVGLQNLGAFVLENEIIPEPTTEPPDQSNTMTSVFYLFICNEGSCIWLCRWWTSPCYFKCAQ